jgi:hypothetical protein
MAENEKPILIDKNNFPDDKLLASLLGSRLNLWLQLMKDVAVLCPGSSGTWTYYNDGHNYLFKMVYKKKTLFWSAIFEDTFGITFYFGDKAEILLNGSDIPQIMKDNFKTAKRYGAIRAISIRIFEQSDVENVLKLIAVKNKLK